MKKITKREEYIYLLGYATAIAGIDEMMQVLPKRKQRDFIERWIGIMKETYQETSLWEGAKENLHKPTPGEKK